MVFIQNLLQQYAPHFTNYSLFHLKYTAQSKMYS